VSFQDLTPDKSACRAVGVVIKEKFLLVENGLGKARPPNHSGLRSR
jgi:hypothetical protein